MAHQTWLEHIYAVENTVGAIVEEAASAVQAVTEIAVAGTAEVLPRHCRGIAEAVTQGR
jgi:hypothetical protein